MYYVVYGFLWLISLLPLPVLYLVSDFFYVLVFYVFKYRRSIVMNNLAIAFPEKTIAERTSISKRFYRNFIDSFIETIKLFSASKRFVEKRSSSNFEIFDELARKGYSVNIMAGHQFNWELGNLLYAMHLKVPFVGIYMPITNKVLDRIFINLRKRYGTILISAKDFKSRVHTIFNQQHCFGLAADQNPGNPSNSYWMDFFGKPVPWVTGPSKGAVRNNAAEEDTVILHQPSSLKKPVNILPRSLPGYIKKYLKKPFERTLTTTCGAIGDGSGFGRKTMERNTSHSGFELRASSS